VERTQSSPPFVTLPLLNDIYDVLRKQSLRAPPNLILSQLTSSLTRTPLGPPRTLTS
jgi:hypothetical protein